MERRTRDLLAQRFGEIMEVIVPPSKTAVPSPQSVLAPSVRDRHIAEIETKGRMAWQKSTGYQQAQPGGDPDEPMEGCDRAELKADISAIRKQKPRSASMFSTG